MVAEEGGSKGTAKGDGERRGARRRAPVTIDLKAEKVEAAADRTDAATPEAKPKDAAAEPKSPTAPADAAAKTEPPGTRAEPPPRSAGSGRPPPPPPPPRAGDGWRAYGLAGLAGGVVAFLLIVLLQAIGLLPTPGQTAAGQALEQSQGASDTAAALERRVMALEAMTETLPASIDRLDNVAGTVTTLQATDKSLEPVVGEVESLKSTVADLGTKLDAAESSSGQALADLTQRVTRLAAAAASGGSGGGGSPEAIATLSDQLGDAESGLKAVAGRVDALEKSVAALEASSGAGVDSARAARAVAFAALRRAAAAGGSFTSDLGMLSTLGVSGDAFESLRPLAADSTPSAAELAAEFPGVASAILAATAGGDPDAGFFQRLVGSARGLVSIRPAGPVAGDDPPAIVSRMQAAVDKGDLATALDERDGLPDAGKEASASWAAAAADRIKIDSLIDQVAQTLDPPSAN
jgi:hypothetical protein